MGKLAKFRSLCSERQKSYHKIEKAEIPVSILLSIRIVHASRNINWMVRFLRGMNNDAISWS